MARSLRRRLIRKNRLSHRALLNLERLGCDQLERRLVLDGLPVLGGDVLTIAPAGDPTVMAIFGDLTYEVVGGEVTITSCSRAVQAVEIPTVIDGLPVTRISNYAFQSCESLTSVTIPDGVTFIGDGAFMYCRSLTSITIPDQVTYIGDASFWECTSLASVTIGNSVTVIGPQAFWHCSSLASYEVAPENTAFSTLQGVLFNKSGTVLVAFPEGKRGDYVLPDSVTRIGNYAFFKGNGVTSVTIPSSVVDIGSGAFRDCTSLVSITIPDGVTSIGIGAFYGCVSLTSVAIPNSLTIIEPQAFIYCHSLTNVTIPSSVTTIAATAFYGCTSLASIAIPSSVTTIVDRAFSYCYSLTSITFKGSPPRGDGTLFDQAPVTVYYYSDQPGWESTFAGRPTVAIEVVGVPTGETRFAAVQGLRTRLTKTGPGVLVIDAAATFSHGAAVEGGTLVIRNSQGLGGGSLSVAAGARVVFETGNAAVELAALEVDAAAQIDIGTSRIAVAAGGFTEAGVRQSLLSGYNGGLWDGNGISSSAAPYQSNRAVGYRIADGVLELAWAAFGDTNLDGVLNTFDLVETQSGGKFNTDSPASWQDGDFNYDGRFNILDLVAMSGTGLFGQGSYLPQEPAPAATTLDPMWLFAALAEEADEE